jgi:hypothetical protein
MKKNLKRILVAVLISAVLILIGYGILILLALSSMGKHWEKPIQGVVSEPNLVTIPVSVKWDFVDIKLIGPSIDERSDIPVVIKIQSNTNVLIWIWCATIGVNLRETDGNVVDIPLTPGQEKTIYTGPLGRFLDAWTEIQFQIDNEKIWFPRIKGEIKIFFPPGTSEQLMKSINANAKWWSYSL